MPEEPANDRSFATYVTEEDCRRYAEFVARCTAPFMRDPPEVLWHYTTGPSLIKIIESQSIFCTQIACLNDYSEFSYGLGVLCQKFEEKLLQGNWTEDERYLIQYILSELSQGTTASIGWFVTCFSSKSDDLSQWRAYGSGENSYALGLHGPSIRESMNWPYSYCFPVNYNPLDHDELASSVADATVHFFMEGMHQHRSPSREEWANNFLTVWSFYVGHLVMLVKDRAFEAEDEWRIIYRLRAEDAKELVFLQRGSLMSRHLPLRLSPAEQPQGLPISHVMVGPSRHKEISRVSVADLLNKLEYPMQHVTVSASKIPFQTI